MSWNYVITDSYNALTTAQINENAEIIYNELTAQQWSIQAICGALGNMTHEGQMNPGQCENGWGVPSSPSDIYYLGGLGLIGWTAYLRDDEPGVYPNAMMLYAQQLGRDWWDGNLQVQLLANADDNPVSQYFSWLPDGPWSDVSFSEYKRWNGTSADAAACFCWNVEKPGNIEATIPLRRASAEAWYEYFTGGPEPPTPPSPPEPPEPGELTPLKFLLLFLRRRGKRPFIRRR